MALRHEPVQQAQSGFARAAFDGSHQRFHDLRPYVAHQRADLLTGELRTTAGYGLIHDGKRVAHGTVSGLRQHSERLIVSLDVLFPRYVAELSNDLVKLDGMKAE